MHPVNFQQSRNNAQTYGRSTDSVDLIHYTGQEKDTQENNFPSSEVYRQSVTAEINLATELILKEVERLCNLVAKRNELDNAVNDELPFHDVMIRPQAHRTTGTMI